MSTRQTRNSKLGFLIIPLICIILLGYFAHHAWSGRYGIESMARLEKQAERLDAELAAIREKRLALAGRVKLLREGSVERDMLDEQARHHLNVLRTDEIMVLR